MNTNVSSTKSINARMLTISAVCIAIGTILSKVELFALPQGGTITAGSMLFVSLIGFWFGPALGITAGAAFGFLQVILDGYVVHPVQLVMDYPLAFAMLGLSGLFRNFKNKSAGLYTGYIVGCLLRWFWSFLSGCIFFASFAPENMNVLVYSAWYNMSFILPEMLFTVAIISVPKVKAVLMKVS